jgi:glycopeptide antibiotics resistance protein
MLTTLGLWEFVTGPATLAVLGATLALAWPVGRRLADRVHCPRAAAVALALTVGVICALTLTPNQPVDGIYPQLPPHYLHLLPHPRAVLAALSARPAGAEQLANIALYVPLGLFARFVWRSAVQASALGLALTVMIETCQYGIIGRAGSLTDIRNNTAGAILGALIATAARRATRRRQTTVSAGPER